MPPEESSPNTPPTANSGRPLSREEVAIGGLSQHYNAYVNRSPVAAVSESEQGSDAIAASTPVATGEPSPQTVPASLPPVTQPVADSNEEQTEAVVPAPPIEPQPSQTLPSVQTPFAAQTTQPQPSAPRLSKLRRFVLPISTALVVIAVGGGFLSFRHWQAIQNNPNTIFSEALQASLATTGLQAKTTTGSTVDTVDYNFTNPTNPVVSTQETVNLYGSDFHLAGYGSAKDTFVSYTKFPADISSSITSLATNGWIQLRSKGVLPEGVDGTLTDASDPRYQAIGVLTFGDFSPTTRTQLVNYLLNEHIYAYKPNQVKHTELNGAKVIAYPVTLNVDYLKVYDQSVAVDEGFSPTDVQDAINALNNWQGAQATFYVSATQHRFVQVSLTQAHQNTTIGYDEYNKVSVPGQPETELTWDDFAPIQLMIQQESTQHQEITASAAHLTTKATTPLHG